MVSQWKVTHKDTWIQVKSTLLVSLTIYYYFSKLSTNYAKVFNLSGIFTFSLKSIACQYAKELGSALLSYFTQFIVHNVFQPLKLFTWKFLNR